VNYIDLWGLSGSDGGRKLTEEEKRVYTQAAGRAINFDAITIYEGILPTMDDVKRSGGSIGYDLSQYDTEINTMLNDPYLSGLALPDGRIYLSGKNSDDSTKYHELNHIDTFQNGAVININGAIKSLDSSYEVLNQLINEGLLFEQYKMDPNFGVNVYTTPGYLEYYAEQMGKKADSIIKGGKP
jgi:hypothetical protein